MTPRPTFDLEIGHLKVRLGERTLIMGAINVTPDSFSDGGLYIDPARAVEHGLEVVGQGADWIDVGGESTRPGSRPVSVEEELRRVLPVIRTLRSKLRTTPISIDTTKAEVAE
jgi:dihydropteroate synthase